MSTHDEILGPTLVLQEEDEILLVQATGFDAWFLDALNGLGIAWETIPGVPGWIQFETESQKLRWLMHTFSDITIDLLE